MPIQRYSVQTLTAVAVVTTDETVVATITGVTTPRDGCRVQLFGNITITTGTATTDLTWRWRRGTTITGTLVGEGNAAFRTAAAGSTEEWTHTAEDTPGDVAGQSYVLTVQQAAATANGSVLASDVWADVVT